MRNEAENIPHFIDLISQLQSDLSIDLNAAIVNNGSVDGTQNVIASLPKQSLISFFENPVGSTYADGIEFAISKVSSAYILIIPSDLQFAYSDVLSILKLFFEKTENHERNDISPIAIFTFRKFRTDGRFMKFRGYFWRLIVTRVLKIESKLDPASQLKIIPTPKSFVSINRNFLWDIEVLLRTLKVVTSYDVVDVSFQPRIYGESALPKNPFKSAVDALLGLIRLTQRVN
jgi:hypothetical protein